MTVMNVMLGKGRGGLEAVAFQYARLFAERGHRSLMLCNCASPFGEEPGVERIACMGSSRYNPLNYLRLVWAVRKYRPDVVFGHGGRAAQFCTSFARRLFPRYTRLIGVAHGANTKAFREMDSIIAVSESVKQELIHDWAAPEGRIRVVPNAVKLPPATPAVPHADRKTPVIGFLGRLDGCKALDTLIKACAILKERGIRFKLKIGGDGPEANALRQLAEDREVAANIEWCGWVEDKDAFFDTIDVFVLPSRREAFGVVMLEAMSHSRPVVVSDCLTPKQIVTEAGCGLVFSKDNAADFATALATMLTDPAQRAQMAESGYRAVEAQYSEDRLADTLEDIAAKCDITRMRSLTPGRIRVLALMLADVATLMGVWAAAILIYASLVGFDTYMPTHYWNLWPLIPMFIAINIICRLYHGNWMYPAMPLSPVEEFRRIFASAVFAHLLLMAFLGFVRHNLEYSRLLIGVSGALIGMLAQSVRNVMRWVLFKLHICQIPVALAGSGETAKKVESIIGNDPHIGFDIVLKFDDKHLRDIVPQSQRFDVKVLLACQEERLFRAQLREFSGWFNYIEYLPRLEVFPILGSHAVSLDGMGGLEMMNRGRMKALRWEKRVLDFVLSAIVFVLLSPLFVILPVIIKLTSKGPVFYVANRLGRLGRPIKVFKFRTMYADADRRLREILASDPAAAKEYARTFKLKHDPRVTPFGRFLRKTSLDELPQIFNVFRGDMSLIGPRPIVQRELEYYGADYEVFSRVRPGITGLWQCSGRSDTNYTRRVALDIYYVLNWSPWMDIWILIRTVFAVLFMKGAY